MRRVVFETSPCHPRYGAGRDFGKDPQFAGTRCGYGKRMGQLKSPLVCVECHKRLSYEDAAGWQAYIVGDTEIENDAEVVMYCPACARREFGPFGRVT